MKRGEVDIAYSVRGELAEELQRTPGLTLKPAIVQGVIEHYAERGARSKLRQANDSLRLVEDLGIDSLTMLEIVFLAEEVLQVSIDNEELRPFRTVGDVKAFVAAKLRRSREPGPMLPTRRAG